MARCKTDLPSGIIKVKSEKSPYQARIFYKKTPEAKKEPRSIGSFSSVEAAVAALVAKQALFNTGGPEAVWPSEHGPDRAKRGTVSALVLLLLPIQKPVLCACVSSTADLACVHCQRAGRQEGGWHGQVGGENRKEEDLDQRRLFDDENEPAGELTSPHPQLLCATCVTPV
jgi:hypothetical protein